MGQTGVQVASAEGCRRSPSPAWRRGIAGAADAHRRIPRGVAPAETPPHPHQQRRQGVIGRVGTLLGDGGVNTRRLSQARLAQGGEALRHSASTGGRRRRAREPLKLPDISSGHRRPFSRRVVERSPMRRSRATTKCDARMRPTRRDCCAFPTASARPTSAAEIAALPLGNRRRHALRLLPPATDDAPRPHRSPTMARCSPSGDAGHHRHRSRRPHGARGAGVLVGELKRACASHELLFAPSTRAKRSAPSAAPSLQRFRRALAPLRRHRHHVRRSRSHWPTDRSSSCGRTRAREEHGRLRVRARPPGTGSSAAKARSAVVVEAELSLLPLPEHVVGLAIPFATELDALRFVVAARESADVHPRA